MDRICLIIFGFLNIFIIFVFFFNDTATTEIYTLSLHDALPIFSQELVIPLFQYQETVVYTHHGVVIGLPIVICTSILAACTDYLDSGAGSIKGFVAKIPHMEIPIGDDDAELLRSINTLKDLYKLAIE